MERIFLAYSQLHGLLIHQFHVTFSKEKVSDEVMCDLTVEDLKSLGLSLGQARLFKKEAEAAAAAQLSPPLAPASLHASQSHSAVAVGSSSASHAIVASISSQSSQLPRSLATSHFKREYDTAECPELRSPSSRIPSPPSCLARAASPSSQTYPPLSVPVPVPSIPQKASVPSGNTTVFIATSSAADIP
ncbi:MAG: hypothetical protein NWQ53_08370, partial [Flavobacteriales bacterium]|nr:hypothetical protein [Flavobacteriales bacterium]